MDQGEKPEEVSSTPSAQNLEKDEDGVYDLSAFAQPMFRYALPEMDASGEPTGRKLKCSLPLDTIVLRLQTALPTAFVASGTETIEVELQGKKRQVPAVGIARIMQAIQQGKQPDPSLPSIEQVLGAIERAFEMPGGYGTGVKMALLSAFMKEMGRRTALKKGTRDSLDSPEPSQAASTPEVSTPTP